MTTDIFSNQISNPEGNFLFAKIYSNEDGDIKRYIAKYYLSKSIAWGYNVIINGKTLWWLSSWFWYKMKRRNKNVNKKPRQRLYDRMFITLHGKPYFLFPDVLERWSFPKNCARTWSFLHYWERWYFFLPKIWSYTLDGKWKVIFLKKMHGNMIFSSNFLKRWFFQKGPRRHMIFLVSSGKMVFFFPENMIFFPWVESETGHSQEIHGIMTLSVYTYGCYKRGATPLLQKKSKMVWSRKNTAKGDWCSRLTSYKKLQQFSELSWRPLQAFSCIVIQRRKTGKLIYRIEIWILLKFSRLEIFYKE